MSSYWCHVTGLSVKSSFVEAIYEVDAMEINDAPRFEHRGVMVDVARNFHRTTEILKLIDTLAMYKLNKLHLHLADDEGWRLEIPGLKELTEVVHSYMYYAASESDIVLVCVCQFVLHLLEPIELIRYTAFYCKVEIIIEIII